MIYFHLIVWRAPSINFTALSMAWIRIMGGFNLIARAPAILNGAVLATPFSLQHSKEDRLIHFSSSFQKFHIVL
jgi:hypothetical protein